MRNPRQSTAATGEMRHIHARNARKARSQTAKQPGFMLMAGDKVGPQPAQVLKNLPQGFYIGEESSRGQEIWNFETFDVVMLKKIGGFPEKSGQGGDSVPVLRKPQAVIPDIKFWISVPVEPRQQIGYFHGAYFTALPFPV